MTPRRSNGRFAGVVAGVALLVLTACNSTGTSSDASFWQNDLSNARAPAASGNDAITAIGDRMLSAGDADGAIGAYRRAATAPGASVDAMLRYGNALMATGSADYAAGAFADALARKPRDPAALRGLGAAQMAQGKTADAVPNIENAVREQPDAKAIRALAVLRTMEGRTDEARAVYDRALTKWPQDLELRVNHSLFEALADDCKAADREGDAVITSPFVRPRHVGVRALAVAVCGRDAEAERIAGGVMSGDGVSALMKRAAAVRSASSLADKAAACGIVPSQGGDSEPNAVSSGAAR